MCKRYKGINKKSLKILFFLYFEVLYLCNTIKSLQADMRQVVKEVQRFRESLRLHYQGSDIYFKHQMRLSM
jgi:hypothetical protein